MSVKSGESIRYAGRECVVLGTATNSETGEEMVIYRVCGDDDRLWTCPLTVWEEEMNSNDTSQRSDTYPQTIQEHPTGVHNQSSRAEKIDLILSLFAGRSDVYAKRWESNRNKRAGYVPHCRNQ